MRATLETMRHACGLPIDDDRDGACIVGRFIARVNELRLKPGCLDLLNAALGRVPMALASSSPRNLIDAVVGCLSLGPFLDVVLSGEAVDKPKPAPDIFLRAAAELGAPPGECVVFEDSLAGVRAARAAGATVIAVPELRRPEFDEIADAVVADLGAARALIVL
jgi:sugar-phosphatase